MRFTLDSANMGTPISKSVRLKAEQHSKVEKVFSLWTVIIKAKNKSNQAR